MRILFIIPSLSGGGAETQTCLLATELSRRNHEVHVAYWEPGPAMPPGMIDAVHLHRLRDDGWKGVRFNDFASVFCLARRIKPAVIQTCLIPADIFGGATAIALRIPWVVREANGSGYDGRSRKDAFRAYLGRHANAIVSNAIGGVNLWRAWGASDEKLELVPNAVRVAPWHEVAAAFADNGRGSQDGRRLLIVGRMVPQKDVATTVQTIGHLLAHCTRRICVEVFGQGPEAWRWEQLRNEVRSMGGRHDIRLHGFRDDWLSSVTPGSVLLSTSLHEGRPNVPWEALGRGATLVLSDIEAHREIVEMGNTGATLVNIGDFLGFALAVQRAWENSLDMETVRKRWDVAHQFSAPALAASYEAIYMSILNRTIGGRF